MKNKILKKILASVLIIALTAGNLVLIGNTAVSYAVANLENQNESTAHENVKFGAYFESEGKKIHSLICDAKSVERLYIHLNVKQAGFLKNGKIEIQEANYEIKGELGESEIIGSKAENTFYLKQITYGTEAILEIPIGLNIQDTFNIEDINKNSKVKLTGTYITPEGNEIEINKEVILNVGWEGNSKIEAKSELTTYKTYEKEEKGIILQERIEIERIETSLPISKTKIEVSVPDYKGFKVKEVRVNSSKTEMTNGNKDEEVKLDWNYNEEIGIIEIEVINEESNKTVYSKHSGKDEYIITYEYGEEAYNSGEEAYNSEEEAVVINRKAKIYVENYSNSENKTVEKIIENQDELTEEKGSIINGEIEIEGEINKARIYANYNSNNREYETEYKTKERINIVKSDIIEEIVITERAANFINQEGVEYSSNIQGLDYIYYKTSKISIENFNKILGEEGSILIENSAGRQIGIIDKHSNQEEGCYVINYENNEGTIILKTTAPKTEGTLIINHTKAIKADLAYNRDEVEKFKNIQEKTNVGNGVNGGTYELTGNKELKEAVSNLKIESNKDSINNKEESIELRVEFGNNKDNSILYVNPIVRINLPKFVEEVEITNTNLLFEEELKINQIEVGEKEGQRVIEISLQGTQTKFNPLTNGNGSTLVIGAKLINKDEAGEDKFVAEIEGNTAETGITSYLKATSEEVSEGETNLPIQPDIEVEPEEKPRIELTMNSGAENIQILENHKIGYIINVNNISDYLLPVNPDEEPEETPEEPLPKPDDEVEEIPPDEEPEPDEPDPIKNIIVKDYLPAGVTYEQATLEIYNVETGEYEEVENATIYDAKNRVVTWNVGDMTYEPSAILTLIVTTNQLSENIYEKEISNSVTATYDGMDPITSNVVKTVIVKPEINVTKLTENVGNINQVGDKIKLMIEAKNAGNIEKEGFQVSINLPEELEPISVIYGKQDNLNEMSMTERTVELEEITISPEETYICEVEASINELPKNYEGQYKTITPVMIVNGEEIKWTIKIQKQDSQGGNPEEPTDPETPENPDNPGTEENYIISGIAWLDENENGIKEENEKLLENIEVSLENVSENLVAKTTITDSNGCYSFEGIAKGEYQIIFSYEGDSYQVTEYRKTGQLEINSSAIAGEKGQALTDVIEVIDEDIQHMNIGLVKTPIFDMSLTKEVSKVVVQNKEGTKTYENTTDFAKVDINGKYLNDTVVLIEYKITIKNEGEQAGKVKKIVDYMPTGMIFSTELNRTWVEGEDGNLYNSELKDLEIEPGETKELALVLRKNMTEDNVGLINNTAELAEVENKDNIKDKDSTPNNKVQGEDDISSANVLLGVRTGSEVVYITLGIVVLIILATGIYIINRKVLKSR